jgi:hypothetical protein
MEWRRTMVTARVGYPCLVRSVLARALVCAIVLVGSGGIPVHGEERTITVDPTDLILRVHTTSHTISNVRSIVGITKRNQSSPYFDTTAPYQGAIQGVTQFYLSTSKDWDAYAYLLMAFSKGLRITIKYETEKRARPPWSDLGAAEITSVELADPT